MAFDVEAARKAGYSDDEIIGHLTQSRAFDVSAAEQAGYSKEEVITYLSNTPPKETKTPENKDGVLSNFATGFTKSLIEQGRNLGKFGQEIYQQTGGRVVEAITGVPRQQQGSRMYEGATPQALTPVGGAQRAGAISADVATAMVPGIGVTKAVSKAPILTRMAAEGATALGTAAIQGASPTESGVMGAIGASIPAVGVAASKVLPKILSFTSGIGDDAFKTILQRRGPVAEGAKKFKTPEETLSFAQGAVKTSRKALSQEWADQTKEIVDTFVGARTNFSNPLKEMVLTAADEFGIEKIPQNMSNVSVKEGIDLLTEVNEVIRSGKTALSPRGAVARKLKEELSKTIIKNFGGDKGKLATLYKNYSKKSGALEAFDKIVSAYKTNNPKAQRTARNALMSVFKEDAAAYLSAVTDFEETFGYNILSKVANNQFQRIMPTKSALGGSRGDMVARIAAIIALPLTSPRMVRLIQKYLTSEPAMQGTRGLIQGAVSGAEEKQPTPVEEDYLNKLGY